MLLTKYQHVADVVVEFYSCTTCVKGVYGGLNGTTIHQYFKKCLQKNRSKEPSSHSF